MIAAPADAAAQRGEDYYEKLGVTKVIHTAGRYTNLTTSVMPASVQAAVARAAEAPVRLVELQKGSDQERPGDPLHTPTAFCI